MNAEASRSYAHEDAAFAEDFLAAIKAANPRCRVFFDRDGLDPGCAWQQRIYDSLNAASTVVAMFSPAYVRSDFCKEEYNIALYKRRQGECGLLPVYILATNLPAYMAALSQHVDCREGDRQRLSEAAKRVAAGL